MIGSLKPPTNKSCISFLLFTVIWPTCILVFYGGYPESIVACDIWHHSRCSGIEDAEALPPLFVHTGRLRRHLLRKVVRFFIKES